MGRGLGLVGLLALTGCGLFTREQPLFMNAAVATAAAKVPLATPFACTSPPRKRTSS